MFKQKIEQDLKRVILDLGFISTDPLLTIPQNPQFGDYSSNIPLQLAKLKLDKPYQTSLETANAILEKLGHPSYLERAEVAGAGFLNFFIKDESLLKILDEKPSKKKIGKNILVEYSSPNAAKPYHLGHLRNIITGEAISRILEYQGHRVFRATYNSDIGLALAKVVWGVKNLDQAYLKAKRGSLNDRVDFLGEAYVKGTQAYENKSEAKNEIEKINQAIYKKGPEVLKLWEEIRSWSAAYLDMIHTKLGTEFDATVWESEVAEEGRKIVEENINKVFKKDQEAVIFPGKEYGLHNRVFINSEGNPTYEAKEIGVTFKEQELFPFDEAIHVVSTEQSEYFRVVIKAIELLERNLTGRKKHLSYGFVNLTTGKMSSRLGNIVTAEDLIEQVKQALIKTQKDVRSYQVLGNMEKIGIAAIKFSFLKYSLGSDITFDIEKSISLQGDSGPYLQYAYARISSLLVKSQKSKVKSPPAGQAVQISGMEIEPEERELLRQLEYFEATVDKAASEFKPNELCSYLLNLAKAFNLFYERYPILGSERQELRLALSKKTAETLKLGLYLLGIEVLERM